MKGRVGGLIFWAVCLVLFCLSSVPGYTNDLDELEAILLAQDQRLTELSTLLLEQESELITLSQDLSESEESLRQAKKITEERERYLIECEVKLQRRKIAVATLSVTTLISLIVAAFF